VGLFQKNYRIFNFHPELLATRLARRHPQAPYTSGAQRHQNLCAFDENRNIPYNDRTSWEWRRECFLEACADWAGRVFNWVTSWSCCYPCFSRCASAAEFLPEFCKARYPPGALKNTHRPVSRTCIEWIHCCCIVAWPSGTEVEICWHK